MKYIRLFQPFLFAHILITLLATAIILPLIGLLTQFVVQLSGKPVLADGEVIVIHDADFMKIAGVNLKVWDATIEDLKNIDIGSWFSKEYNQERTPTLREVLLAANDRVSVLIELKYYGHDDQLANRVVDVVEKTGMVNQVAFMSLATNQVAEMKTLRPDWQVGQLAAAAIGDLTKLNADFLAINTVNASAGFIRRAHKSGKNIYVWTIDDPITMSQMMSRGANGLITNEPKMANETIIARRNMPLAERLMLEVADFFGIKVERKNYRDNSP